MISYQHSCAFSKSQNRYQEETPDYMHCQVVTTDAALTKKIQEPDDHEEVSYISYKTVETGPATYS